MKRYGYLAIAGLVALGSIAAAGCGDDDEESTTGGTSATTQAKSTGTSAPAEAGIVVSDAWCRESPMVAEAGACYMMIENTGGEDDALVKVTAPTSVAAKTEIHETVMAGGDSTGTSMAGGEMTTTTMSEGMTGTSMAGSGEMQMQPVDRVDLPAGETVELKPGGYHVMLLELAAPLEAGSTVELTLEFEKAASQTVQAEVRSA